MINAIDYGRNLISEFFRRLEAALDQVAWTGKLCMERVPIPLRVRGRLRDHSLAPWTREVIVDKLLLGYQGDLTGSQFAARTNDLMWTSRRVADGPHADLLRRASQKAPSPLTDQEILTSPYGALVGHCVAECGQFFGERDPRQTLPATRAFLLRYAGTGPESVEDEIAAAPPIRVARIRHSDYYQLLDGHHRAAAAAVAGLRTVRVRPRWVPAITAVQSLVGRMSWIKGRRELYQPLPSPELSPGWKTVRRCSDRLEKITASLQSEGLLPPATERYLDVASCYGWFVSAMGDLGYHAEGIELDPLARPLGSAAYGLNPEQISIGDCVTFLRETSSQWDVVSCFSFLHHCILGRTSATPAEFMGLLGKVTGRVLFLDSGQSHEAWFRKSMPEWTTAKLLSFLSEATDFTRVVDLGPDVDSVVPYQENYGRHLFACIRD